MLAYLLSLRDGRGDHRVYLSAHHEHGFGGFVHGPRKCFSVSLASRPPHGRFHFLIADHHAVPGRPGPAELHRLRAARVQLLRAVGGRVPRLVEERVLQLLVAVGGALWRSVQLLHQLDGHFFRSHQYHVRLRRSVAIGLVGVEEDLDVRLHRDCARLGGTEPLRVRRRRVELQLRPAAHHLPRQNARRSNRVAEVALEQLLSRAEDGQLPLSLSSTLHHLPCKALQFSSQFEAQPNEEFKGAAITE